MENSQDQPLPPGVPSWPNYAHAAPSPRYPFPPNAPYNLQQGTLSHFPTGHALTSEVIPNVKPTEQDEEINSSNSNLGDNTKVDDATVTVSNNTASNYYGAQFNGLRDIDIAAQDAVLREQEIAMQNVIRSQREGRPAVAPNKDNLDVFSERRDPNALKEHLLKMATEHRAEMAVKRGKAARVEEGNTEIGNGYGVPGGGAYYDAPTLNTTAGSNAFSQSDPILDRCSEQNPAPKELPEYLKQRLRARGILGDNSCTADLKATAAEVMENKKLPPGWVEAKDPGSGACYYYNESTGKSQWEKPQESYLTKQSPSSSHLPEYWVDSLDETTGLCALLWRRLQRVFQ